ncbi:MAG: aldehyde dehydrogenase [Prolixibacteraceae bacterium]|nr:aldehyde dehydrogenase [Prolixibacteraceae bacterium]MBN2775320.1 aldehyde dehydrogenase [Prolixibacteraceae bacterium]
MDTTFSDLLKKQDVFFNSYQTRNIRFRISQLKKLKQSVENNEKLIYNALWSDLRKSEAEAYSSELGLFYNEISLHIRKLKKWSRDKKTFTPLICFPSSGRIQSIPFGRVLIIGAFNFPVQLCLIPLIGAISAGNTAILKPSEQSPETSSAIANIINSTFPDNYIHVIEGDVEVNKKLLKERWDLIFFTGSPRVGKIVMEAASKNLTPVVLELGGKNPALVDENCNLQIAAKRVTWGKFYNVGQSCVAVDYLLIHKNIEKEFLTEVEKNIKFFYTSDPQKSKNYMRIVNDSAVDRITSYLKSGSVYYGGKADENDKYISPTILTDVDPESPLMQDEIFGPVLPVISYSEFDEAISFINKKEKPLVAYLYSSDKKRQKQFLRQVSSGDACINDSVLHFVNHKLPFGGIGNSGMGAGYHGKFTFETFSHKRSVLKTTTLFDLPLRYPPYKKWALKVIRLLLR